MNKTLHCRRSGTIKTFATRADQGNLSSSKNLNQIPILKHVSVKSELNPAREDTKAFHKVSVLTVC